MSEPSRRERRYAVLTEGFLSDPTACKTAFGVIRFRPEEIACVVDSEFAGKRIGDVVPALHCGAPIVASVQEAIAHSPTSVLVGVATHGGVLPPQLRASVLAGIDAGLEIVSGLHQFLNDDPEFVERARRSGAKLW